METTKDYIKEIHFMWLHNFPKTIDSGQDVKFASYCREDILAFQSTKL